MIHRPLKCIHFTWQINLFHAKQLFTKTTMVWICLHSRVNSKLSLFINISVVFCLPFHYFFLLCLKNEHSWLSHSATCLKKMSNVLYIFPTFHSAYVHFTEIHCILALDFVIHIVVFPFISHCNNRIFFCQMYLNYEVKRKNTVCLRIDDGLLIKEHR